MLYGRDAERTRIGELLRSALDSRSGVLVVRGEPGVGKTALLDDTRVSADGMLVLSARGVQSESDLPFAALHQLLRPIIDKLDELPAPQAAALGTALGVRVGAAGEHFLVFAGSLSLLAAAADEQPLLCVVDDAHWLDSASADALLFIARRVAAEPIAMLFATREVERGRFSSTELPELVVRGLVDEAADELLAEGGAAPAVRRTLVKLTGGNALALLELPQALSEPQLAGREPLPAALPLTRQVEEVFLARVRDLPEPAQRVLLVAAADESESLSIVLRAAETFGATPDALTAAEEAGLVRVESARLYFRHPLVRSAVYSAAPSALRRSAHSALATALDDRDERADRRAWHLAAAALEPDEQVVAALEDAAERARDRAAYMAASRALERAAELSADPGDRGRRLVAAAAAAGHSEPGGKAVALAEQAAALVDDPLLRAEITRVRGEGIITCGRPVEARALLTDAAERVAPIDPRKALELLMYATRAVIETGDIAGLSEVAAVAQRVEAPAGDDLAMFLSRLLGGFGALLEGRVEAGTAQLEAALAWAETSNEPRHVAWASSGAIFLIDYDRAARLLERAAGLARERGAFGVLTVVLTIRAPQLHMAERFEEAGVAAHEALTLARELGAVNLVALAAGVLTILDALHGDEGALERHATEALELGNPNGLALPPTQVTWARARLALERGRWEEALAGYTALTEVRPGFGNPVIAFMSTSERVEAAVRAGRIEDARAAIEPFAAWTQLPGAAWARPNVDLCRALVSDGDEATNFYETALDAQSDSRPFDRARTHLLFGEHLRRQRRRGDSRDHLRAALDGFEAVGATLWTERARAELRATGETTHKRDVSSLAELTPQERHVAHLVSEGLSNKEVAAQLFLSPRTIDAHLRSVFAKLGITKRTQLARMPLEFGDLADVSEKARA